MPTYDVQSLIAVGLRCQWYDVQPNSWHFGPVELVGLCCTSLVTQLSQDGWAEGCCHSDDHSSQLTKIYYYNYIKSQAPKNIGQGFWSPEAIGLHCPRRTHTQQVLTTLWYCWVVFYLCNLICSTPHT